jgi:phage terminase large subunit
VKICKKFKPLFEGGTRYFILTGGRGSGKSFAVSAFLAGLTFSEPNQRILFTRYTMVSAHISIIPEFEEKIEMMQAHNAFEINKSEIVNSKTKAEIIFKGIKVSSGNQTAALKSLQGITTWVLDEAEELVDERIFDKIEESVRVKGERNRIIIILNPTTKEHWIYQRFFEQMGVTEGFNGVKGDVTYIHTTYLDNIENLNETIIHKFEQLKINKPKEYAHRVMGGWLDKADGVVIENWSYGEFDDSHTIIYGLDYGFYPDPTALIQLSVDQKKKIIYARELIYEQRLNTDGIALRLPSQYELIVCDNSEPRLTTELQNKGFNMRKTTKGAGSIKAGIDEISKYQIIVDNDSTNLGRELNNYVWNDRKASIPIDDYNHLIDALRYAIMELASTRPTHTQSHGKAEVHKRRDKKRSNIKKFL